MKLIRRNDPCPCGSGIKYKKCCLSFTPDRASVVEHHELSMSGTESFDELIVHLTRSYPGLETESIKSIASALFLERQMPDGASESVSYIGLFKYYDGVLEQEFRKLIEWKEGWILPKDYMFQKIHDYLSTHELGSLKIQIPNLVPSFRQLVNYRNKISHGEDSGLRMSTITTYRQSLDRILDQMEIIVS